MKEKILMMEEQPRKGMRHLEEVYKVTEEMVGGERERLNM